MDRWWNEEPPDMQTTEEVKNELLYNYRGYKGHFWIRGEKRIIQISISSNNNYRTEKIFCTDGSTAVGTFEKRVDELIEEDTMARNYLVINYAVLEKNILERQNF